MALLFLYRLWLGEQSLTLAVEGIPVPCRWRPTDGLPGVGGGGGGMGERDAAVLVGSAFTRRLPSPLEQVKGHSAQLR